MNSPSERDRENSILDLKTQISKLEDQYVEFFLGASNEKKLKRIYFQLEVLKAELKLNEKL